MIATLYSFRRCPYAMRARMALLVSGVPFELREVLLRDKPAAMIAASAKATVPVLVTGGGRVIDESLDIMRWALARHDPENWLAGDDATLIAAIDGGFKRHLDRYKYAERHDADPHAERQAGLAMLMALETRLAQCGHLCGAARSLADIAIFPFVRQFAGVDAAWFAAQPVPCVRDWLARQVASPLFAAAMTRVPRWIPSSPPVLWPADAFRHADLPPREIAL